MSPTTPPSRPWSRSRSATFGGLDWACNIAGIAPDPKPFVDHSHADWQRTIDVNLSGVFYCMQHELREMLEQGLGGAIVNMSSGAGVVPAPGQPQYTAAKHGVLGLTKQAAQEYASAGHPGECGAPRADRDRPDARRISTRCPTAESACCAAYR